MLKNNFLCVAFPKDGADGAGEDEDEDGVRGGRGRGRAEKGEERE